MASFPQMRQVGLLNNATVQLGSEVYSPLMHSQIYEPNLNIELPLKPWCWLQLTEEFWLNEIKIRKETSIP